MHFAEVELGNFKLLFFKAQNKTFIDLDFFSIVKMVLKFLIMANKCFDSKPKLNEKFIQKRNYIR